MTEDTRDALLLAVAEWIVGRGMEGDTEEELRALNKVDRLLVRFRRKMDHSQEAR